MAMVLGSDSNVRLSFSKQTLAALVCQVINPAMVRSTFAREDTEPLPGQVLQPLPEGPRVPLLAPKLLLGCQLPYFVSARRAKGYDSAATACVAHSDAGCRG